MTREEELEIDLDAALEAIKSKDKEIEELKEEIQELTESNEELSIEARQGERLIELYGDTNDAVDVWKDEVLS